MVDENLADEEMLRDKTCKLLLEKRLEKGHFATEEELAWFEVEKGELEDEGS